MKEIFKNKKTIVYVVIALIIILGIIATFVFKLNFTVMYSEHTQINVYLGKEYNLKDIKEITKEALGNKEIAYQEIESFRDSIAISVKEVNDEQVETLQKKLKEKYEIKDEEKIIQTSRVGNLRGRDIVKPYIMPVLIATLVVVIYVGIRYFKLGIFKIIGNLLLRILLSEALLLSIIAITRIPISVYTMPIAILLYIAVIIYTVNEYEDKLQKSTEN